MSACPVLQIFDAAKKDMPDLEKDLAAGKFAPLKVRVRVVVCECMHACARACLTRAAKAAEC